jgi:hypothetical protein
MTPGCTTAREAKNPALREGLGDAQVKPAAVGVKAFPLHVRHCDGGEPIDEARH